MKVESVRASKGFSFDYCQDIIDFEKCKKVVFLKKDAYKNH